MRKKRSVLARTGHQPHCSTFSNMSRIYNKLQRHFGLKPSLCLPCSCLPPLCISSELMGGSASSNSCKELIRTACRSSPVLEYEHAKTLPLLSVHFYSILRLRDVKDILNYLCSSSLRSCHGNVVQHTCSSFGTVQKFSDHIFVRFQPFCLCSFFFLLLSSSFFFFYLRQTNFQFLPQRFVYIIHPCPEISASC